MTLTVMIINGGVTFPLRNNYACICAYRSISVPIISFCAQEYPVCVIVILTVQQLCGMEMT